MAAAKAAGRVRERFYDPDTGRVLGKSLDVTGEVPTITEYGLGGAMNAARAPDKSTVLSQAAQDQLHATLDALRRQAIVQGVKRSATAGGGSNTASDLFAAGAADLARQLVNGKRDAELAAALQDPAKMLGLLKARLASGDPLTPYETSVLSALQAGAKVPEAATH